MCCKREFPIFATRIEQRDERKESAMNWIFEAYSNVYNAALMQDKLMKGHVAPAKDEPETKRFLLLRPFTRG